MGLFIDLSKYKILKEVEVNGKNTDNSSTDYTQDNNTGEDTTNDTGTQQQDNNTNEEETTDYTTQADNEEENTDETSNEENQDNTDNQQQDDNSAEEETTDYTNMDSGEDESGTDDGSGDSGTDSGNSSTDNSSDEEAQTIDDIKKKEEELFNNLSPEQMDIRHRELKNKYLDTFDMVNGIIERLGNMDVDNISAVEYVSNTLSDLKTMLSDYMNHVYKTKSYTENLINYNRFLAVLSGVNKILEELNKKTD